MEQKTNNSIIKVKVFEELCDSIGRENVFDNIEERICYSFDATKERAMPDLVIRPHTNEHVSTTITIANKHNIPICPRGAGTGLSGGAVPIRGGIVLDMMHMNRIIEISTKDLMVTVEPGVITGDLQNEVIKHRLFYPPDPGSAGFSTIGGNVAECTGGMTGLKYGVTRDYVLALEIVLPDGSIINTGRKTLRSVAGYDLTRLFVGSEGTLGVFTRITLKLLPLPENVGTIISYFKTLEDALNTADTIRAKRHFLPRSLEFIDETCIKAIRGFSKESIPEEAKALLLIDVDGNKKTVNNDISNIEAICKENNALKTLVANAAAQHYTPGDTVQTGRSNEDEDRNIFWDIRRSVSPSLYKIASMKFNDDFCVPRSKVREVLKKVYELSKMYSIQAAAFGHIGEGHIHLNLIYDDGKETELSVHSMITQILKEVVSIGGTITAEHGVGDAKSEFVKLELTPHEIGIMKELKKMFDPKGIMNPGKIFV